MGLSTNKFSDLFRKYRLKAEFRTLSEFGLSLSEKGLLYEDSIFSHWQSGTRTPQNRAVMLKLIEVFVDRGAITKQLEANEFLASVNQGYLSEDELTILSLRPQNSIFQVPSDIGNFSNREELINYLSDKNTIRGKVILLHGGAGVGKTALAIRLGHILKNRFNDGVLWYKVEENNVSDILLSIAKIYGEDISGINNIEVRSTVVRSILGSKDALLFLDNSELFDDIHLLIPNSKLCTTIITSKESHLSIPIPYKEFAISSFDNKESLRLFTMVLGEDYVVAHKEALLKIAKKVGGLPLSLHLISRQLLEPSMTISRMYNLLDQDSSVLEGMFYENKSLKTAVALSYKKLDEKSKSVLVSSAIFKGKDFSANSIAYINGLSIASIINILDRLIDLSLIEKSTKNRYRIHPVIREFALSKLNPPHTSFFISLAVFMFVLFLGGGITAKFLLHSDSSASLFSATYFVIAVFGSFCGFYTSRRWGGLKTTLGKSVLMFSIGLLLQSFGQVSYAYYIHVHNITVPYPSIGDLGYFGTVLFYIYGVLLLAKASGIKLTARSFKRKLIAVIVPAAILLFGYFLFLQDYVFNFSNPLKVFLDFAYPLGEAVFVSIALLIFILSRKILDGIMRSKALLLLGALFLQYLSDYVFLYNSEDYTSASYIDALYLTSYFIMTLALLNLRSLQISVKN